MVRATEGMGMAKVEAGPGVGAGVMAVAATKVAAVGGWVVAEDPRPRQML